MVLEPVVASVGGARMLVVLVLMNIISYDDFCYCQGLGL